MSNNAKLKKKAAEFEGKKQYEKALELYEQVLNGGRTSEEDRDVPLYNRVGDLHYRIGNNEKAINYYEQAADLYAEGGFFNNAIALCNKILRYSPGRAIIYYKLGIISARKGFNSDAKQNFLEYADRMQKAGKMDEAFGALKEFADLCPGQDDVRLMLAEQLARADRKAEALEQLALLYDTLEAEGRSSEAAATLERMKALDPSFKPKRSAAQRQRKKDGLVFLDLDLDPGAAAARGGEAGAPAAITEQPTSPPPVVPYRFVEAPRPPVVEGLEVTALNADIPHPDPSLSLLASDSEPDGVPASELRFLATEGLDRVEASPVAPLEVAPLVELLDEKPPAERGARDVEHSDDDFIDLGEWLERNRTPASTRMVTHDEEPQNDEQKDFAEMLDKFKTGISRNVDEEDFDSHYDLGIAFREMGLLDEAIGSFQKATRGTDLRVRASEAIAQCFLDKGEAGMTITVLERLVEEPQMSDARMVGVLYLLGRAAETLGRQDEAAVYYQRVLAVQIGFRDAAERLTSLTQASR